MGRDDHAPKWREILEDLIDTQNERTPGLYDAEVAAIRACLAERDALLAACVRAAKALENLYEWAASPDAVDGPAALEALRAAIRTAEGPTP